MACRDCAWWERAKGYRWGVCVCPLPNSVQCECRGAIIFDDDLNTGAGCPQFKPRESSDGE